jgi:hypothetical protein
MQLAFLVIVRISLLIIPNFTNLTRANERNQDIVVLFEAPYAPVCVSFVFV